MIRGCVFKNGCKLDEGALCALLTNVKGLDHFIKKIKQLNGFFSVIYLRDNMIYIAVDHCRSIPLFYSVCKNRILISDDAYWIKDEIGETHKNIIAEEEFILLGYVTGSDTLYSEIRQVQAGEVICITNEQGLLHVNEVKYTKYVHKYDNTITADNIFERFDNVLANMVQRMVSFAGGRQILLPLSGGLDSRLLALLLKKYRYDNVATFSYGNIRSEESIISRTIAEGLKFPWFFVPYSIESWRTWFNTPEFQEYKRLAFQFSSCVHIQDFPAIWELKRKKNISNDAVIMPGICADLQAGSMSKDRRRDLYNSNQIDLEHVIESIIDHHYVLFDWSDRRSGLYPYIRDRIALFLGDLSDYPDAASAFESQFCAEKVAKYLVNSMRAYDYWIHDWWLPYWDTEFIKFWETIPLVYRIDKIFYDNYVYNLQNKIMETSIGEIIGRDHSGWFWDLRKYIRRTFLDKADRVISPLMKKIFIGQNNEFGWFGIMNKHQFKSWYTGRESIQSALVLEYVGRLTIEP